VDWAARRRLLGPSVSRSYYRRSALSAWEKAWIVVRAALRG
jgi:hypothetical protein